MEKYTVKKDNFIITDYARRTPFSSFLPGIAGADGMPVYAFYVNRGQCVSSFGSDGKDGAIMDFRSADDCYADIDRKGFRTFIKADGVFAEGFKEGHTKLSVYPNHIEIEEINPARGYTLCVKYFVLPHEPVCGLVRHVTIKNDGPERLFEIADGMAVINSYGVDYNEKKIMPYLAKAYCRTDEGAHKILHYKKDATTFDTAEVRKNITSNYFFSIDGNGVCLDKVCDPRLIFGDDLSLAAPENFINKKYTEPYPYNKILCAFSLKEAVIGQGEQAEIISVFGKNGEDDFLSRTAGNFLKKGYFNEKFIQAAALCHELTRPAEIQSAYPAFDSYVKNCYLDNILRGGTPVKIADKLIYLYSRKHGDLERDYNAFSIKDGFYSAGRGNYRDVLQNRRMDNFFSSGVGTENIVFFLSLIGLDGYNPLNVCPSELTDADGNRFSPGDLYKALYKEGRQDEFEKKIGECGELVKANYAEGYWTDHFAYNLDLIEQHLRRYPERREELLYGGEDYKYFNTGVKVRTNSKKTTEIRDKKRLKDFLDTSSSVNGFININGKDFTTNLIVKLINVALVKFLNLDKTLTGIEMEGGKPGWCDPLNGLPALFGSCVADSFELYRLLQFICENLKEAEVQNLDIFRKALDTCGGVISYEKLQNIKDALREKIYSGGYNIETTNLTVYKKTLEHMRDMLKNNLTFKGALPPTYRYRDITDGKDGIKELPPFLEGVVKASYLYGKNDYESLYRAVKKSGLYDKKLKMYKTSCDLSNESIEIGRILQFTPGYLERESVFMHMCFKYLLALLKKGLYDIFFEELKAHLPCFMEPEVYGRSIFENCSFIASSDNPDKTNAGRGFYARLTGANVEILNILSVMQFGLNPFSLKQGRLCFTPAPVLHNSFFGADGLFKFRYSDTEFCLINKSGKNTYDPDCRIQTIKLYGGTEEIICGGMAEEPYSSLVRDGKYFKIEIIFA